ncbi:MAG: TIGR01212 family radical SAM protein [Candidatus Methylomirabilia bacterium]
MDSRIEQPAHWHPGRRYYDFKTYLRNTFGTRVAKLPIDAGFTCPNRDGRSGTGGCIFCDGRGSKLRQAGPLPTVTAQLAAMRERYLRHGFERFIPYFQTFTNTDAPLERLRALWDEAVGFSPDVVGLAVGTRPDCVPEATLDLLAGYRSRVRVHLELGLQSSHPQTIARINRGHTFDQFADAVRRAAARGIEVVAHVILGLPGETPGMMRETALVLAALPIAGLKIHALLVIDGTALAADWRRGEIPLPDLPTYAGWVADFLELLPPGIFIERLTADGYRDVLLAPDWARNKLAVLNAIERELARRGSRQGCGR